MRSTVRRRVILTVFAVLAVLLAPTVLGYLWLKTSYLRGELAARRDVRDGQYRELGYGLPTPWRGEGAKSVHARFPEAQFVPVAGCIVSPSLQEYVRGYNHYAKQAAIRHFGRDVFDEAFDGASKAYRQQYAMQD
jgi:hypothetical protein